MSEHRLCLVLTTESSLERAESLAEALLERRLVACASLFPVRSRYRWAGRMERSDEVQLLLKTSPERLNALQAAVFELHSYDIPEWIHWHAAAGGSYGEWCAAQLSPDAGPPDGSATPGGGGPAG
jgi:periplasmic divalent cation tolerance protein